MTGKPILEDLSSGKATVLMALAMKRATPRQRETLTALVGRPDLSDDGAARIRDILHHTGARETVEEMIGERHHAALRALDTDVLNPQITDALRRVAARAVNRTD
jgi:geranylgeranyl diphosphate synthase, type I